MTDNHGYYNRKNESDQFHESHDVNTSEVIQAPISERTNPPAPKPESAPDNRNKRPPEETSSGGEQVDRDANPPNPSPPDEDPFDSFRFSRLLKNRETELHSLHAGSR